MKIQLIEDWRKAWRLWSVRYALVLAALPEVLFRVAEAVEHLLPALSQPVLDNLPAPVRAAASVLALIAVALRLLRQPTKGPPA